MTTNTLPLRGSLRIRENSLLLHFGRTYGSPRFPLEEKGQRRVEYVRGLAQQDGSVPVTLTFGRPRQQISISLVGSATRHCEDFRRALAYFSSRQMTFFLAEMHYGLIYGIDNLGMYGYADIAGKRLQLDFSGGELGVTHSLKHLEGQVIGWHYREWPKTPEEAMLMWGAEAKRAGIFPSTSRHAVQFFLGMYDTYHNRSGQYNAALDLSEYYFSEPRSAEDVRKAERIDPSLMYQAARLTANFHFALSKLRELMPSRECYDLLGLLCSNMKRLTDITAGYSPESNAFPGLVKRRKEFLSVLQDIYGSYDALTKKLTAGRTYR